MLLDILIYYLKFFVSMLIYRHISRQEFNLRWLFLCPFLFAIIFTLVPPVGFFGYYLVFIAYSFYRNRNIRHLLNIFYGLYPVVVESLIGRLLAFYVFPMLGIVLVHEASVSWYDALLELLVFPVYLGLTKLLKLDFTDLKVGFQRQYFNRFLLPMDLSMFVYLVSVVGLVVFEDAIPHADALREHLNSIYLILFFVMLLYFNAVSKERLKQEILEQKDRQLQELATYSQHVEMLYGEIRAFRHDYLNILTSLKLSIEHEDLNAIREVYENVLRESGQQFYDSKFDIAKLSHIENPAVKSVLSAKLLEAQNKGIGISVEIDEPVRDLFIEVLDFITFLSILCDNAIEASIESDDPQLTLAMLQEENSLIFIVENSTKAEKIDLARIFEKDYSSKGEGRGLGLYKIQQLLEKYPKTTVSTKSLNYRFTQSLTFWKE